MRPVRDSAPLPKTQVTSAGQVLSGSIPDSQGPLALLRAHTQACYQSALPSAPEQEGTLFIVLSIDGAGAVKDASVTLQGTLAPAVGACAKIRAEQVRFKVGSPRASFRATFTLMPR